MRCYKWLNLQQATEKLVEKGGETQAADDGENRREQDEERGEEPNDQGKYDGQQAEDDLPGGSQGC